MTHRDKESLLVLFVIVAVIGFLAAAVMGNFQYIAQQNTRCQAKDAVAIYNLGKWTCVREVK